MSSDTRSRGDGLFEEIFEEANDRRMIRLETDEKRLRAFLTVEPRATPTEFHPAEVMDLLGANGILAEIDEFVIERAAQDVSDGGTIQHVEIARGLLPIRGEDGQVVWEDGLSPDGRRRSAKDHEKVDFREVDNVRNVAADQKICTIEEPTTGKPGRDIFGNIVAGEPGRPIALRPGKNVKKSPDGRAFYAKVAGNFKFERNTLSVEPVFFVAEDIDYSVGNIDFVGGVRVGRNVLDEFQVRCDGPVEVGGMIGAARIEAGGDVMARGGVTGRLKGLISAGGRVTARYLDGAVIEARDDVTIAREIVNSTVKSLGRVLVDVGGVIGGHLIALAGIEIPVAGSPMGVKTVLTAGISFEIDDVAREIDAEIADIDKLVERISIKIGPLVENKDRLKRLPSSKKEVVKKLVEELKALRDRRGECVARLAEVKDESEAKAGHEIIIKKLINPGVEIQIGDCRRNIEEEVIGPVRLTRKVEDGTIRIRPL